MAYGFVDLPSTAGPARDLTIHTWKPQTDETTWVSDLHSGFSSFSQPPIGCERTVGRSGAVKTDRTQIPMKLSGTVGFCLAPDWLNLVKNRDHKYDKKD